MQMLSVLHPQLEVSLHSSPWGPTAALCLVLPSGCASLFPTLFCGHVGSLKLTMEIDTNQDSATTSQLLNTHILGHIVDQWDTGGEPTEMGSIFGYEGPTTVIISRV